MGIWVKILVFGSKYLYLDQNICIWGSNIGIWVKYGSLGQVRLVWQIWPSGQELGSQAQGPGSLPLAPLDPTSVLVGGASSGGYFSPKSPSWKWEIVYFLDLNKKCQNLIIHVDLALCAGYNLCASRRRTLRGLFFTKKSILKMRNKVFPEF